MSFYFEELSTFEYYKKKTPLFYRDSYGYLNQFEMLFRNIMTSPTGGFLHVGDMILSLYDIFNENYLDLINTMDPTGRDCDMLDKIGSIFGVTRTPNCLWYENGVQYGETLILNNEEFLMLIKCEIIKNNFRGTREECNRLYDLIGLNIFSLTMEGYGICARCKLVLASTPERQYSDNIVKMFKSGLLNIKSVGILYEYVEYVVPSGVLIWDSNNQSEMWDFGGWSDSSGSDMEWDNDNWDEGDWAV